MPRRELATATIAYTGGPDAPDDMMTPESLAGGEQWVGVLSEYGPRIPGLYHCKLCISECARLCLHHPEEERRPPWRRVISRCARIDD